MGRSKLIALIVGVSVVLGAGAAHGLPKEKWPKPKGPATKCDMQTGIPRNYHGTWRDDGLVGAECDYVKSPYEPKRIEYPKNTAPSDPEPTPGENDGVAPSVRVIADVDEEPQTLAVTEEAGTSEEDAPASDPSDDVAEAEDETVAAEGETAAAQEDDRSHEEEQEVHGGTEEPSSGGNYGNHQVTRTADQQAK